MDRLHHAERSRVRPRRIYVAGADGVSIWTKDRRKLVQFGRDEPSAGAFNVHGIWLDADENIYLAQFDRAVSKLSPDVITTPSVVRCLLAIRRPRHRSPLRHRHVARRQELVAAVEQFEDPSSNPIPAMSHSSSSDCQARCVRYSQSRLERMKVC